MPDYDEIFNLCQGPLIIRVILRLVVVSRLKEIKALDLIGVIFKVD